MLNIDLFEEDNPDSNSKKIEITQSQNNNLKKNIVTEEAHIELVNTTSNNTSNDSDTKNDLESNEHIKHHITPFTEGSQVAYRAAFLDSLFDSAPVPLTAMLFKSVDALPLYISLPLLITLWGLATRLIFWVNYYVFIERLTPEFGLELETQFTPPKKEGTLYFFPVKNEHNKKTAHYTFLVKDKDNSITEEIGILDDLPLDSQEKLYNGTFKFKETKLSKTESALLKETVAKRYPHHKPILQPDEDFIPGDRRDPWFFILCAASEFPTFFAGVIFGYTLIEEADEDTKIALAVFFGLLNWLKNILIELPVIANAYAKDSNPDHIMGPIEDQPGTWLVFNLYMLLALKNIAPAALGLLTDYGIFSEETIPLPSYIDLYVKIVAAIPIYWFSTSTTLVFTMYALQSLNLKKTLNETITLHHTLAEKNKHPVLRFFGELLGCRALTISLWLQCGFSPRFVAKMLTYINAIANIVLIYDPTVIISDDLIEFFVRHIPNASKNVADIAFYLLAFVLIFAQGWAAWLLADSQYSNYLAVAEERQKELGIQSDDIEEPDNLITSHPEQLHNPIVRFAPDQNAQDSDTLIDGKKEIPASDFAKLFDKGTIASSHFYKVEPTPTGSSDDLTHNPINNV